MIWDQYKDKYPLCLESAETEYPHYYSLQLKVRSGDWNFLGNKMLVTRMVSQFLDPLEFDRGQELFSKDEVLSRVWLGRNKGQEITEVELR